ncbi:hypothetical protein ACP4OV_014966 [Aristida adscensionis]
MWRAALAATPPPPRPLPWLLLPVPGGGFRASCALSGGAFHDHITITLGLIPPGARFVGSHDGAWLFRVPPATRLHRLLNLRTGNVWALPRGFRPFNDDLRPSEDMVILAATLSAPPGDRDCVAAAIVAYWPPPPDPKKPAPAGNVFLGRRRLVLWRMGAMVALDFSPGRRTEEEFEPEDVVYHDGAFRVLTRGGDILVHTPLLNPDGVGLLGAPVVLRSFRPVSHHHLEVVLARYLVASRGEVLMVERLLDARHPTGHSFRVFREVGPQAHGGEYAWSELPALGGRILFVGHGCSRAYDAELYEGLEEGIYFHDDATLYEEYKEIGNADVRRTYTCNDNGRWSSHRVTLCLARQEPSHYSPPVWLLP